MRSPHLLTAATIAGCALALTACGGTTRVASQLHGSSIAPKVTPPSASLITEKEINVLPTSSPRRSFFSMWSDLQWQSWPEALSYYHTGLILRIGEVKLLQVLKFEASLYRTTKPRVEEESTQGPRVTIRYIPSAAKSDSSSAAVYLPTSVTWEKVNGQWIIYYDSGLNSALRAWAQAEAQQTIDPTALTPSPRAVVAGIHAGELQDQYLASAVSKP